MIARDQQEGLTRHGTLPLTVRLNSQRQCRGGAGRHPARHAAGGRGAGRHPAHPGRAQGGDPADRGGRAGAQVRPDHRLRDPGHRGRRAHPRPQLRHARVRARLCRGPGRAADADGARGRAALVPGLCPRQRQGRHAQLYRHPVDGELLGLGVEVHRRAVPGRGAGAVPERRRDRRDHPRHRLRHGRPGGGLRHPAADAVGLRRAPQLRLDPDDRAGLRGDAALLHEGGLRHPVGARLPHHDAAGRGRHAAHDRARPRDDQGDAAPRQRVRPPARLGGRDQPGAAVRRLGRLFGLHRQPGAGPLRRPAGAQRRHGHPVGDARDLRRRASA